MKRMRQIWNVLFGKYPPPIKIEVEQPPVQEAQKKLDRAHRRFFLAVKGVVEENQRLREQQNARKSH